MTSSSHPTELKNFLPLSKLGEGAFSTVYKVKRVNDGQVYALKKIKIQKLKQKQKQNALNEIRILASIKSKYIISYKEAFYDQSLNLLCIVMEYANGGDLQKQISDHQKAKMKFSEKQIWKAVSQILIGLYVLHEKGILHRDLKSANVFISNNEYKLGDLNVSKINYEKDQMARTQTGTPYYASPEVWRDEPYDSKCDIWSLGCLIYEMCCFEPPFQGTDLDELYKSVQKGKYRQIPSTYSSQLESLIKLCLKLNPKERPSGKELFMKFKVLNQKLMECIKNNELELGNKLMNTIHLPFDLKDLPQKLPLPEYQNLAKEQPRTVYHDDTENKETVMLKNKSGSDENKKMQSLPERIKSYFKDDNKIPLRKRPQRPVTSSKRKEQRDEKKEIRPSSAHHINKRNYEADNISKLVPKREHKILQKVTTDKEIAPLSLQKKDPNTVKPFYQRPFAKNLYNPNQYRCKSSEYQNRPKQMGVPDSPLEKLTKKQVETRFSSQKPNHLAQLQQPQQISQGLPTNFSINHQLYENCKENSMKKISSLEKKVRYIRDQRKERKVILQKNKENISCVFKPINNEQSLDMKQRLKEKIRQNSQILRNKQILKNKQSDKVPVYMPVIKQRICSGVSIHGNNPNQKTELINNQLERRKNNPVSRRYIVSADGNRARSYTEVSNEQSTIINERGKKYGVIRKIPFNFLPSILADKISSKHMISQPYIRRQQLTRVEMQQMGVQNLVQNSSLIDNSDTIMRLKKRIKSRIVRHNSKQKSDYSLLKHNQIRNQLIYY